MQNILPGFKKVDTEFNAMNENPEGTEDVKVKGHLKVLVNSCTSSVTLTLTLLFQDRGQRRGARIG